MSGPRRIIEAPTTDAERQVALAASVDPAPLDHGGWEELTGRALMRRPSALRLVPAFALSTLAGVLVVLLVRPVVKPAAPRAAEAIAAADARWSQISPEEVSLEAGRLTFTRPNGRLMRIRTPDAVLETVNARFLAEVMSEGTTVVVEEGEVVLRSPAGERTIRAGESLTWPPLPVIPAGLSAGRPMPAGKCQGPANELRGCLEVEAKGTSLDAEAATYELGVLEARAGQVERAVEVWRGGLERFPEGVLAPEVRIALVIELVKARRLTEAHAEAKTFVATWPDDPRRADVDALAKALEQGGH